ncbi:MAG: ComEC family competence protein [Bacteroidales bacterium]|jgi:competence protein ComEC|nr:ComEC family competence protein [Bacteroidales bacterium]
MKTFFHQAPFVRFLLPFLAGLLLAFYVHIPATALMWTAFALFAAVCALLWQRKRLGRRREWLFGLFSCLFLMTSGAATVAIYHYHYTPQTQTEQLTFVAVVEEPPVERANSMKMTAVVHTCMRDSSWEQGNEKVILYIRKDSLSLALRQGDKLMMNAALTPVSNAGNPYEFDYVAYLLRRHISRSAFVESGKWTLLQHYAQNPLMNLSNRIRNFLLGIYKQSGLSGNELAVASALTLGYRASMDNELLSAYSASGAMHILAVSGMHVAVYFLILNLMFGKITFLQRHKIWWVLIMLGCLWLYALITGMSPSVLRATVMFSIIVVGMGLRRKAYIYNSMAASAFLLLLVNPANIFDVGFQLSYMAVLSIVFFYPKFYAWLNFKNPLADKLWQLTCSSVAAQLGTAPISLFYFHQFPNYFLLTNFIAIPLSSLLIYGAVILFILSPVPALLHLWGQVFNAAVYILNASIFFIEKLPGSLTGSIRFGSWENWLAYALMIFLTVWLLTRRHKYLILALIACLAWVSGSVYRDYRDISRKQLLVYNSQGNTVIQMVNGRQDMVWHRSRNEAFPVSNLTHNACVAMRLNQTVFQPLDSAFRQPPANTGFPDTHTSDNYLHFAGKHILIFDRHHQPHSLMQEVEADIVIVTQNIRTNVDDILRRCTPKIIVADASNTPDKAAQWEEECKRAGVPCHNTQREGAFVADVSR